MPASAQKEPASVSEGDQAAIRQVIEKQLAAFQHDDGATAFSFDTAALRQRFGTADNFMRMVRGGYQPVYRPSQVQFGGIENADGTTVQHVLVVGPDGNFHEARYFMEREKDGSWLIDGCLLTQSDLRSS